MVTLWGDDLQETVDVASLLHVLLVDFDSVYI